MLRLTWLNVFDAYRHYPATWDESIKLAKERGFHYIAFNGAVFSVYVPKVDYDNRICEVEDIGGDRYV